MIGEIVAGTLIALVILFVIFKVASSILKFIGFLIFVSAIILTTFSIFVFLDMKDFKENENSKNTMLLVKDNSIVAALDFGSTIASNGRSSQDIAEFNKALESKEFESIKRDSYKLYFIDYDLIAREIMYQNKTLTKMEVSNVFVSKSVTQESKNMLFSQLIVGKLEENSNYLMDEFSAGNIQIYPQTAMFIYMKYFPDLVVEKTVSFKKSSSVSYKVEYKKAQ